MTRSWTAGEALGAKHREGHNVAAYKDEENTFSKKIEVRASDANALEVYVDTGNGDGMKLRFAVERNPTQQFIDVDFYGAALVIGGLTATQQSGPMSFLSPAGSVYNPIQVYRPGSAAVLNAYLSQAGALIQNVGGQAGVARQIGVEGDANPRHREDEFGKHEWGAGGASAVDTNLYRAAADQLKTDDRLIALGGIDTRVVATASLPAAGALMDGHILIEDVAAGDRNIIIYAGGERFRIDGGVAF